MKELQTQLGFNFGNGLSRKSPVAKSGEIEALLTGLEAIYERWGFITLPQIAATPGIRTDSDHLFSKLGPSLWPDVKHEKDLPNWLLGIPRVYNDQFLTRFRYSNRSNRKT